MKKYGKVFVLIFVFLLIASGFIAEDLKRKYVDLESVQVRDRHDIPITRSLNSKKQYAHYLNSPPVVFTELLLKKEDRFFYLHPGVNPLSVLRSLAARGTASGASTLTQQLVKILLDHEQDRRAHNKLQELIYALALELFTSKETILTMYSNVASFGNQAQGVHEAARVYFATTPEKLTTYQAAQLVVTLSNPTAFNPWQEANADRTAHFLAQHALSAEAIQDETQHTIRFQEPLAFELVSLDVDCNRTCHTTLDASLTETIRSITERHVESEFDRGVRAASVVVLKEPEHEVLALVGSYNPKKLQIDISRQPRPIGSTIKPFIYGTGFNEGLRPYSLVDDREYRYSIATGFPLYPKNFDGAYRGEITLHEALANSLNTPSVKVLEYVGLEHFYDFLSNTLGFLPLQDYDSYQYGIALGGLEMDLLTLTHFFGVFANNGLLRPLTLSYDAQHEPLTPHATQPTEAQEVLPEEITQLVTAITSDRTTGVEQFGLQSNLNLSQENYGVKTGTSRDFHDSWVVGYTPDFVVGVWVGDPENKPLIQVTGQSGAGAIWRDVMEVLFASKYNLHTPLPDDLITTFALDDTTVFGLPDDTLALHRELLMSDRLIITPHAEDTFFFELGITVPLAATESVTWLSNGNLIGEGSEALFQPKRPGTYEIEARGTEGTRERITISITENE